MGSDRNKNLNVSVVIRKLQDTIYGWIKINEKTVLCKNNYKMFCRDAKTQ